MTRLCPCIDHRQGDPPFTPRARLRGLQRGVVRAQARSARAGLLLDAVELRLLLVGQAQLAVARLRARLLLQRRLGCARADRARRRARAGRAASPLGRAARARRRSGRHRSAPASHRAPRLCRGAGEVHAGMTRWQGALPRRRAPPVRRRARAQPPRRQRARAARTRGDVAQVCLQPGEQVRMLLGAGLLVGGVLLGGRQALAQAADLLLGLDRMRVLRRPARVTGRQPSGHTI
jgi:hypothetical protein